MATNFKYTNVEYADIVREIQDRLNADPRFDNYRESAIVQQLIEIFAGAVDITNYYLQRRAEECYFDTAQLRSSVILLSRQLGYVVQRPIPATAKLKFKLKGDFSDLGLDTGFATKVQIPFHSVFTYEGFDLILKKTLVYTIPDSMITDMNTLGAEFESNFITVDDDNADIELVQGEIREKVIEGLTNPQVSRKFQSYRIEDEEFSNIYGDEDYIPPTTRVWIGETKDTEYTIDRKSLVNWQNFSLLDPSNNKLCVIRTSINEDIDLQFGDGKYTAIGAEVSSTGAITTYDNIFVQYLGTKGSKGNKTGVVGKKINFSNQISIQNQDAESHDITDKIEFYFKSNLIGGADMEDIDSIRVNAPNIYYSLDRLVTSKDYESYLKTLTSPIVVRNAIAWGEQEEARAQGVNAIKKLFNIVFYTVIGDMYQTSESPYYARTKNNGLSLTVLDNDFDENEIAKRNYYNVYTFQNVVQQLKEYEVSSYFYRIDGNEITATVNELNALITDEDEQPIVVNYKSESFDNIGSTTVTATMATTSTNVDQIATNFASQLQTQLNNASFIDQRTGSPTNGQPAFGNATVTYDSTEKKITIKVDTELDNCYVYALSANPDESFLNALGFPTSPRKTVEVSFEEKSVVLSDKIIDVTNKLKERSLITVQNIYISPVIQNFNIKGKVFVDPLTDKEALRVEIADAIYNWLNINADYNVLIYKSNVIDIINGFNNVKYCNVYFEPQTLTAVQGEYTPFDGTFYNDGRNKYFNEGFPEPGSEGGNWYAIKEAIENNLATYLISGLQSDPNTSELNVTTYTYLTQEYKLDWKSAVNERNFFSSYVKNVYNDLIAYNNTVITNWANSEYFMKEMGLIHKDLLKIIRYNMLDTSGNIAPEYNSNNQLIRGGYSLGNEIAKMDVQLVYEYKV